MATWVAHLAMAKNLEDKLNIKNKDEFYLGSILPDLERWVVSDLSILVPYSESHYAETVCSNNKEIGEHINLNKFFNENKNNMSEDIFLGYYSHLIADYYLNNIFIENLLVYENDECVGIILDNNEVKICSADQRRIYKHKEYDYFDNYIRSNMKLDYPKYNKEMLNKVKMFKRFNLSEDDVIKITKEAKNLVTKQKTNKKYNYEFLSEKRLIQVLKDTEQYILDTIKKNN